MMRCRVFLPIVLVAVVSYQSGCSDVSSAFKTGTHSTWHEKFNWKAEDYFTDQKVIALCRAIEAEDLQAIDRLVKAGANVNAVGKDNMTPLLWAFPDNKPSRFQRLLEHGADPNVIITSDFNTKGLAFRPGDSVTHMAAKTRFPSHFECVMRNGGDANLVNPTNNETPLFAVITGSGGNKKERIQLLIDKGADLDHMSDGEQTPAMQAVSWFGQYRLALMLLNAGADYKLYRPDRLSRLIHIVVFNEKRLPNESPEQQRDFTKLVAWLESHGESIKVAREDAARWTARGKLPFEKMKAADEAEIAERLGRERAAEGKAISPQDQHTEQP